jgi:hypothetical protein
MTSRTVRLALAAGMVAAGGCGECLPPGVSTVGAPFSVVGVWPVERTVGLDAVFRVEFSEDVQGGSVSQDTVVLAPTAKVSSAFISDMNSPPLSASRRGDLVPVDLSTGGRTLTVTPRGPLPPDTGLSIVLSKKLAGASGETLTGTNGKAGHFQADFVTVKAHPTIVRTSIPAGNPPEVPPNLRRITFHADQRLTGAHPDAVTVEGLQGAAVPRVTSVQVLGSAGVTVRVELEGTTCSPFCPESDYRLTLGPPLAALETGQTLTPFELTLRMWDAPDVSPPRLAALPVVQVNETEASISVVLREPSEGVVKVGALGGPYTSSFALAVTGVCTGMGAAQQCPMSAVVTGLDLGVDRLGRSYGAMIEVWDACDNVATYGELTLRTVPLPRILVTEVYNNPPGSATDEKNQEFVEVTNVSPVATYDLSVLSLAALDRVTGEVLASMALSPYVAGESTFLPPSKRAVIGGRQFDPAAVEVRQGTVVMVDASTSRTTLLGGLSASRDSRRLIALLNGPVETTPAVVTLYRAPEELYAPSNTFPEGVSAERLNLTDPDATATWCRSNGAPTPGWENTVEGRAGCP